MASIASCTDLAAKQDTLLDCTGAALPANTQMAKCTDLATKQDTLLDCTGAALPANTQMAKCTDLATKQDTLLDCTGAALPANTQIAKCTDIPTAEFVTLVTSGSQTVVLNQLVVYTQANDFYSSGEDSVQAGGSNTLLLKAGAVYRIEATIRSATFSSSSAWVEFAIASGASPVLMTTSGHIGFLAAPNYPSELTSSGVAVRYIAVTQDTYVGTRITNIFPSPGGATTTLTGATMTAVRLSFL